MVHHNETREPLYFRIKRDLIREIEEGTWPIGQRIPTESKLQARYGASRGTVRHALLELELEGYITRGAGRGTYVASTRGRLTSQLGRVTSFTDQVCQAGLRPSSQVLVATVIKASEAQGKVCEGLRVPPTESVIWIKRLRSADHTPFAIQSVFLLPRRCPGILDEDLSQLTKLYQEKYGVQLASAEESLRMSWARTEEAKLLRLPRNAPVMIRERISFDQNGSPFEVLHSVEVAGRFEYRYHIAGEGTQVVSENKLGGQKQVK
jgi:GntR family transcriptional regulator